MKIFHENIDATRALNAPALPPITDGVNQRKGRQVHIAVQLCLDQDPTVQVSLIGVPEIKLPLDRTRRNQDETDSVMNFWPIKSERVREEIGAFVYDKANIVLLDREITRIQNILAGRAWNKPHPLRKPELVLDQSPTVEVIFLYLMGNNRSRSFDGTATKLITELKQVARKLGINTRSKLWLDGPAQLSRRLEEQRANLKVVGIRFERGRRSKGERYIKLWLDPCTANSEARDDAAPSASQAVTSEFAHEFPSSVEFDIGDVADLELDSINYPSEEAPDDPSHS